MGSGRSLASVSPRTADAGPAAGSAAARGGHARAAPDVPRRRAVHGELRLLRRRATSTSARPRHCSGTGGEHGDATGATPGSLPLGTPVEVGGASRARGTLASSSWITMQAAGRGATPTRATTTTSRSSGCDPGRPRQGQPVIPFWGGPTGLIDTVAQGAKVLSYGNSSLRGGVTQLTPEGGRLARPVAAAAGPLGVHGLARHPGDSGCAFIDKQGRAFGTLSTLADRAARGLQRRRRPVARARLHARARRCAGRARERHRGVPRAAAAASERWPVPAARAVRARGGRRTRGRA